MMQRLAGLKIAAICLCFVALLACSKKSTPSIGGERLARLGRRTSRSMSAIASTSWKTSRA